ncbi:MAG: threonylcarbamoyl-AMP synthase [Clostridia bacterium]|nr:threonylcarbamoyl-AMP synthase [Clostridia bacterium]
MQTIIGTSKDIASAARLIKAGEIVAFPTETVYGLGADFANPQAVAKIFEAKGRPQDNPLIVHLADWEQIYGVASSVPPLAEELYRRFCPGPLTMILPKDPSVPDVVTAGLKTVGVRFPSHPVARELIKASCPIAAPSANVSKHVSPTSAKHVLDDLDGKVPMILDGGDCQVGIESTIIDLTQEIPVILRPGAVTKEMLTEVCMCVNHTGEVKVALAPGMKYIHYTPRCDCTMCDPKDMAEVYRDATAKGIKTVLLAREQTLKALPAMAAIDLGESDEEVMRHLFGALRQAEKKYQLIILERLPEEGLLYSVMNRAKKSVNVH